MRFHSMFYGNHCNILFSILLIPSDFRAIGRLLAKQQKRLFCLQNRNCVHFYFDFSVCLTLSSDQMKNERIILSVFLPKTLSLHLVCGFVWNYVFHILLLGNSFSSNAIADCTENVHLHISIKRFQVFRTQ